MRESYDNRLEKEVEARKDDLLNDLIDLLKVKSEREDDKVTADAPFGPGPRDALLHMLAYGERDGFAVKMSITMLDISNLVKETKH